MFNNNKKEIEELYHMLALLAEATASFKRNAKEAIDHIHERTHAMEKHFGLVWKEEETTTTNAGYTQESPKGFKSASKFLEEQIANNPGLSKTIDSEEVTPGVKLPRKYLKSLKPRKPNYWITEETKSLIKQMYAEGVPMKVIARKLGVSLASVGRLKN